jgi:hypothetical protein
LMQSSTGSLAPRSCTIPDCSLMQDLARPARVMAGNLDAEFHREPGSKWPGFLVNRSGLPLDDRTWNQVGNVVIITKATARCERKEFQSYQYLAMCVYQLIIFECRRCWDESVAVYVWQWVYLHQLPLKMECKNSPIFCIQFCSCSHVNDVRKKPLLYT